MENPIDHIEQFYNSLREKDRAIVRETVDKLKKEGFDVYVTGSSLDNSQYQDIDLVITPGEEISQDPLEGLERVIQNAPHGIIIDKSKDPVYHKTQLFDNLFYCDSKVESRTILRSPENWIELSYSNSPVSVRKKFQSAQPARTPIDIVLTYKPFDIRPETKRLKL